MRDTPWHARPRAPEPSPATQPAPKQTTFRRLVLVNQELAQHNTKVRLASFPPAARGPRAPAPNLEMKLRRRKTDIFRPHCLIQFFNCRRNLLHERPSNFLDLAKPISTLTNCVLIFRNIVTAMS